jgi:hypothetical protein
LKKASCGLIGSFAINVIYHKGVANAIGKGSRMALNLFQVYCPGVATGEDAAGVPVDGSGKGVCPLDRIRYSVIDTPLILIAPLKFITCWN